jgi:hypothetical protein
VVNSRLTKMEVIILSVANANQESHEMDDRYQRSENSNIRDVVRICVTYAWGRPCHQSIWLDTR